MHVVIYSTDPAVVRNALLELNEKAHASSFGDVLQTVFITLEAIDALITNGMHFEQRERLELGMFKFMSRDMPWVNFIAPPKTFALIGHEDGTQRA